MQPIVIAAGGTGGHFFPAEALAACLIERGHRVVLMTDARSAAHQSTVFSGHENIVLPGAGIAGRGLWRGLRAIAGLALGTWRARAVLARLQAACVVGFGGYPSVAPVLAAASLRRRPFIILHEQNAVLGRANRFLGRHAHCLALSFAGTKNVPPHVQLLLTGNPVRPSIQALYGRDYRAPDDTISLLVLGGSLGARIFSDVVPQAIASLPEHLRRRLRVVQQCRPEDMARVGAAYDANGIVAELASFFTDMQSRYQAASLIISRAGASSCAEIAVAGRPSILVPLPGAIDDHQRYNALSLVDAGAATMIEQSALTSPQLAGVIQALLEDPAALDAAAAAAARCAQPNAASNLADEIERMLAPAETVQ